MSIFSFTHQFEAAFIIWSIVSSLFLFSFIQTFWTNFFFLVHLNCYFWYWILFFGIDTRGPPYWTGQLVETLDELSGGERFQKLQYTHHRWFYSWFFSVDFNSGGTCGQRVPVSVLAELFPWDEDHQAEPINHVDQWYVSYISADSRKSWERMTNVCKTLWKPRILYCLYLTVWKMSLKWCYGFNWRASKTDNYFKSTNFTNFGRFCKKKYSQNF